MVLHKVSCTVSRTVLSQCTPPQVHEVVLANVSCTVLSQSTSPQVHEVVLASVSCTVLSPSTPPHEHKVVLASVSCTVLSQSTPHANPPLMVLASVSCTVLSQSTPPQVHEVVLASVDGGLLERISKVISYLRLSASGKPNKKLSKAAKAELLMGLNNNGAVADVPAAAAAAAAASQPVITRIPGGHSLKVTPSAPAMDADIFGDAGRDYTVTAPDKAKAAAAKEARAAKAAAK
jgi:hypothetical protein